MYIVRMTEGSLSNASPGHWVKAIMVWNENAKVSFEVLSVLRANQKRSINALYVFTHYYHHMFALIIEHRS